MSIKINLGNETQCGEFHFTEREVDGRREGLIIDIDANNIPDQFSTHPLLTQERIITPFATYKRGTDPETGDEIFVRVGAEKPIPIEASVDGKPIEATLTEGTPLGEGPQEVQTLTQEQISAQEQQMVQALLAKENDEWEGPAIRLGDNLTNAVLKGWPKEDQEALREKAVGKFETQGVVIDGSTSEGLYSAFYVWEEAQRRANPSNYQKREPEMRKVFGQLKGFILEHPGKKLDLGMVRDANINNAVVIYMLTTDTDLMGQKYIRNTLCRHA